MIFEVTGLEVPKYIAPIDRRTEGPGLCALGECTWPQNVKAEIAQACREIGLISPYKQKAVEPYALAFGGREDAGEAKLDGVNWEVLIMFYQWELYATAKDERAEKIWKEGQEKFGGLPLRKWVYEVWG